MFKKILVANRGEVALRIIRACKELGIPAVAIYSEADADSLHVRLADEAVCVGPAPPLKSYLNMPSIASTAEVTGADAIHPGYGFLAENFQFAEVCELSGITLIGPPSGVMRVAGNKAIVREKMKEAGVPIIPGSEGVVDSEKHALSVAEELGYPVIVKAAAGGGGRGMRVARDKKELVDSFKTARSEAEAAFDSGEIYLEKYFLRSRHIEFQILADCQGSAVHLGERDCSVQRRYQKLIEEAPSPALDNLMRDEMGKMAVQAAQAIGYRNAGTVEFLADKQGSFYFMEINTRIQVEHPVTEMVTGVDVIKEQIRLAAGEKLKHVQSEVKLSGHAIEFRINAEDPDNDFLPVVGRVSLFNPPGGPGVRVDSHLYSGYTVSPHYDSLLAKLIVWGENRQEAIRRAKRALDEFIVVGLKTTIPFHLKVMENAFFKKGEVYTDFIARELS